MTLGWLESLLYGLISGFAEFLPVSADAHRALYLKLSGGSDDSLMRLMVHAGALLALLISCAPHMSKLNRERRIAAMSPKRRRREPDEKRLMDIRLLKSAGWVLILGFCAMFFTKGVQGSMWILAITMMVNGIFLYYPRLLPSANKDGQTLRRSDQVMMGLGAGLGFIPGFSRVGLMTSFGQMRGAQRRYALDMALLLSIPALAALMIFDIIGLFSALGTLGMTGILKCMLAGLASFGSAWTGIITVRFLSVRTGFYGFAYFCWGTALFSFILYLTI